MRAPRPSCLERRASEVFQVRDPGMVWWKDSNQTETLQYTVVETGGLKGKKRLPLKPEELQREWEQRDSCHERTTVWRPEQRSTSDFISDLTCMFACLCE